MTEQIKEWICKYDMVQTGDLVVVGLSGGQDSVCLLCVLQELKEDLGISLAALHVHHGIRGAEADGDAAFCEELCGRLGIPCKVIYVDVPAAAAARKQSTEEAARQERYRALETYRRELGAQKIAVAHHREDNAETVLWNLFRGSGLKGIAGMEPVNGYVIRPLLGTDREEIRRYMKAREQSWRLDTTNVSDEYTRNRIRHHILSYAEEQINSRAAEHICSLASVAAQADRYLCTQADLWITEHGRRMQEGRISLDSTALKQEEKILQIYIIRKAIKMCGGLTDVTARHVEAVCDLLTNPPGAGAARKVILPKNLMVQRSYQNLIFGKSEPEETKMISAGGDEETVVNLDQMSLLGSKEPLRVSAAGNIFELQVFPYEKTQKIPSNRYTKWMDYDKIERTLAFRTRRRGDYILLPHGQRKTVKAYMINEKIPAAERDCVLMAAQGNHILWITGYRLSEGAKITENTKNILQIKMYGGREDG